MTTTGFGKLFVMKDGQNPYLGIELGVSDDLLVLLEKVDETFIDNVLKRNSLYFHRFHITLVNAFNLNNNIPSLFIVKVLSTVFDDIEMNGIGSATKDGNTAYFIPVSSKKLDKIANKYGVKLENLHITIGFDGDDVFGVDKTVTNIFDVKQEMYKKMVGKEVVKKSGKPFKNTEKVDVVKELSVNPHTNKPAFILSCGEFVDAHMCKLND